MPTAVIGTQFGDEGKGKIAAYLSRFFKIGCRDQGGDNAGHTDVLDGIKRVLHLIPSSILVPNTVNVIGNGVVVNPESFASEIERLRATGIHIDKTRLLLSERAHLILPYHIARDCASEMSEGIGTTLKGIGPAYEDKVKRRGIRVCDMLRLSDYELGKIIEKNCEHADNILRSVNGGSYDTLAVFEKEKKTMLGNSLAPYLELNEGRFVEQDKILNYKSIMRMLRKHKKLLEEHACDTAAYLHGKTSVLHESAQGALLDIDMGTYPTVTSSNTGYGGLLTGSGTATHFENVIGVVKAYMTRVGSGPLPTELTDEKGNMLQERGAEVGATTGRKRRCGWLDLAATRHGLQIVGATELAITKLDVLDTFADIKICTGYKLGGKEVSFPPTTEELKRVVPEYKTFPGWKTSIGEIRQRENLPKNAQDYLSFIEQELKLPITIISVGAEREATIVAPRRIESY